MEVDVLRATERPERLVCQTARGDYYEGYVGDTRYVELMEGVDYNDEDFETFFNKYDDISEWENVPPKPLPKTIIDRARVEAQTKAFIEKQLSRGHYGPWEHPQITFAVKGVSRVTMAQITRHRHMTFDVQSMRYADFSEQEVVTPATLLSEEERKERYPHVYDKSDGTHISRETGITDLDEGDRNAFRGEYETKVSNLVEAYQSMVNFGVPKEDARFILPLGTTVNMTFSGNARTFMHLFDMRRKANAQWEIRELSEMLIEELLDWMPHTYNYYDNRGPNKLSP